MIEIVAHQGDVFVRPVFLQTGHKRHKIQRSCSVGINKFGGEAFNKKHNDIRSVKRLDLPVRDRLFVNRVIEKSLSVADVVFRVFCQHSLGHRGNETCTVREIADDCSLDQFHYR